DEFHARLRLSNDQVTTLDLTNPAPEFDFTVSGSSTDFQMFQTTVSVPDGVQSFDLTFISAGAPTATGTIYIDDISAALIATPSLPGDYNHDGIVDAADYTVWRDSLGEAGTGLAADGDNDGAVTMLDYQVWQQNFGQSSGGMGARHGGVVPEPTSRVLALLL